MFVYSSVLNTRSNVADDSDHLAVNSVTRIGHVFAYQVHPSEELLRKRFVDDHHPLRLRGIVFIENATAQKRNTENTEVVRTYAAPVCAGIPGP